MPKMKTHRGAAKRFRVTGAGKLMRRKAYGSHLLTKKSSKRKRTYNRPGEVSARDRSKAKRLIGE
jgi:large subunit ribosomal protein L35